MIWFGASGASTPFFVLGPSVAVFQKELFTYEGPMQTFKGFRAGKMMAKASRAALLDI